MLVMGLESSAHTFGAGIVKNGKVLANEKAMYKIGKGGMIPGRVAEFHAKMASAVIEAAVRRAGIRVSDLEGIGYTRGPGLGPCLEVAQLYAKMLSKRLGIGIAPVNHCVAHIEITKHLTGLRDPLALYVSGGNSQILRLVRDPFAHYSILGETFDIGVGNMLDAFARNLKLSHAWGSGVEKLAQNGRYIPLPYTVKGMDFSFTGLLTKATGMIGKASREDLCFSVQEVSFAMLCEATERALLLTGSRELCVCGGVAQNNRLKRMLGYVAEEHGTRFGSVENQFNADNGAMIAIVAEKMLRRGLCADLRRCDIRQRWRTDLVQVAR